MHSDGNRHNSQRQAGHWSQTQTVDEVLVAAATANKTAKCFDPSSDGPVTEGEPPDKSPWCESFCRKLSAVASNIGRLCNLTKLLKLFDQNLDRRVCWNGGPWFYTAFKYGNLLRRAFANIHDQDELKF